MPLSSPPQTPARFGIMRFGGFRFGYVTPASSGGGSPLPGWLTQDPTAVASWTRTAGEDDIVDEYDE